MPAIHSQKQLRLRLRSPSQPAAAADSTHLVSQPCEEVLAIGVPRTRQGKCPCLRVAGGWPEVDVRPAYAINAGSGAGHFCEPLPLVFGLNGVGGDGQGAQAAFGLEAGHRAIFIYPDSTPHPDAGRSTAWYFESDGVDVAFFDALIVELTSNYCIDMDRIFVVGISSGGIMSNMLGCFRGDVVRAIAPVSGMTWDNSCTGSVAVMVICGLQDSFNPCDTDAQGEVDFWTARNGCTSQTAPSPIWSICEEYQGCAPAGPVLICRHDGGHIWPSGGADMVMSFFMGL
jgi:polyhydroxybutyrate depolymerase